MMRAFKKSLPLVRPFVTSRGATSNRDIVLFEVSEGDLRGYGEAAPLEDFGTESVDEALAQLESGTEPTTPAARYAWDCAHADLEARRAGLPLFRYFAEVFGTTPVESLSLNATLGAGDITATLESIQASWNQGFRVFKLKVGVASIDDDLARIEAVQTRFPNAILRLDANQIWPSKKARQFLQALNPQNVEYVEEPGERGLRDLVELAEIGVPLAADECCADPDSITELIAFGTVDVLVLKPMILGGIARTVEVVMDARSAGMDVVFTSAIDSAVGRTATAHLAAALGISRACGLATGALFREDIGPISDGPTWYLPEESPGLTFVPNV